MLFGNDPVFAPLQTLLLLVSTLTYVTLVLTVVVAFISLVLLAVIVLYAVIFFRVRFAGRRCHDVGDSDAPVRIGLFHPYCNAGGGGERVLWVALKALQTRYPSAQFLIYTGDLDAAPDQIVAKAQKSFNLTIDTERVQFAYLHRRKWVEADRYPFFTLLGQSLGSMVLGMEALCHTPTPPDVFIDTMGYAFTLPLFKYLGQSHTASYVHYPTISTDMLQRVRTRRPGHNNRHFIANSRLATWGKVVYYQIFSYLYGACGRCSDVTMVNSSWTEEHISQLWRCPNLQKIYPPCDTSQFKTKVAQLPDSDKPTKNIVSLGQFRPEKDHPLQIRALARVRDKIYSKTGLSEEQKDEQWTKIRLVLIGGCRNAEDESRVQDLRDLCRHLAVEDNVDFKVNLSFDDLLNELSKATIGLHTMWNEHFGIGVVEMLASGLLTLAHRSGGPLMDIVIETEATRNGFLAVSEEEYACTVLDILDDDQFRPEARDAIRQRARASVDRFSEKEFQVAFVRATEVLMGRAGAAGRD